MSTTPSHSRTPSTIETSYSSPYSSFDIRRGSMHTPTTPQRHSQNFGDSADVFSSGGNVPDSNGLGNLADELADAWNSEEGEDEEMDLNFQDADAASHNGIVRDNTIASVNSSPSTSAVMKPGTHGTLTPPTIRGHQRSKSEYDGSEYGDEDDMETDGIPAGLISKMDMVESLARRGTDSPGTERDGVIKRVVESLKDLGAQGGIEGGTTRLITAHTALSTHLIHQTRLLHSLTYPLFSPLSLPPDEEFIEDLTPLLLAVSEAMPRPATAAFASLNQLQNLTADLVHTFNYLSDTLHMSRQTTTTAARRLKSAKELVAEMRREEELAEEGERWLTKGNWGERLGARECASVCGDVVGGFEEVCEGWRARLLASAEVAA